MRLIEMSTCTRTLRSSCNVILATNPVYCSLPGMARHTCHNNIEDRWLTERLKAMGLDEPGMGWHAFRRFRKTWLLGKRCQEDINIFWMGHKPKTMSEIYSHLFEEIGMRLAEAEAVGFGFDLPKNPSEKAVAAPIAPRSEERRVGKECRSRWSPYE